MTSYAILGWLIIPCHVKAQGDRPLTAEKVVDLVWTWKPVVSPDGSHAVYFVDSANEGKREQSLWLCKTALDSQPELVPEPNGLTLLAPIVIWLLVMRRQDR